MGGCTPEQIHWMDRACYKVWSPAGGTSQNVEQVPTVGVVQVVNGNNNYVVGTNEHRFVYTVRARGMHT